MEVSIYDRPRLGRRRRHGMANETLKQIVKEKYGQAAQRVTSGDSGCCGSTAARGGCDPITSNLYAAGETAGLPPQAGAPSPRRGEPTALAGLPPGGKVPDLRSGGGIHVLPFPQPGGPDGQAYRPGP